MQTFEGVSGDAQIAHMMRFARCTFQVSSVVFYWINEVHEMAEHYRHGVSAEFMDRYINGMVSLDPLRVKRLAERECKIALLADETDYPPEADAYVKFLGEYSIADNLEFVFWNQGIPIGGLGLLRHHADAPLNPRALDLDAIQQYLEFNLLMHPKLREAQLQVELSRRFRLTQREIEVVTLLCAGASNQDIATDMEVKLPTVKTHVVNILDKLGVTNRSSIVGLALSLQ